MGEQPRTARELVDDLRAAGHVYSARVAAAVRRVPREAFVPESARDRAYDDVPLGDEVQRLTLVERRDGRVERVPYGAVQFVPLVGEHGSEEGTLAGRSSSGGRE